ncbi:Regulation of nuclear pre-mRNA domain-containing protein 1A [Trichinella nelsoni]|uniref:Regulation of nuclear pre-mRNA domain-containing protein 1A n=1 Tax=Trichinella nelsoni TaxID=6336 RepID=A0A0V0SLK3_9BILA|nr:Regulation of nuclear pre-mRNA domain-containing protein 1A [Trichinella nelsoni]
MLNLNKNEKWFKDFLPLDDSCKMITIVIKAVASLKKSAMQQKKVNSGYKMSTFPEMKFRDKLAELRQSQQSVQTLSLWVIHHRKNDREIARLWLETVLKERRPEKLLSLFYLVNDVVQNSRRKHAAFLEHFRNVLDAAFAHAVPLFDSEDLKRLAHILDIWQERNVYQLDVIQSWRGGLSAPREDALAASVPKISEGGEPLTPLMSPQPLSTHFDEKTVSNCNQFANDDRNDETRLHVIALVTDVIDFLTKLKNSPSSDAFTRQSIAALPADLCNLQKIRSITDSQELDKHLTIAEQAQHMVNEYVKRLSEEMEMRSKMMNTLETLTEILRKRADEGAEKYARLMNLAVEIDSKCNALQQHYQSLPVISTENIVLEERQMPTVNDLIEK